MYHKILIPIARTSNLKYLIDFVNVFLAPGGEMTFFHVFTSDMLTISPGEWRRAMSAISTTCHLCATEGMCINYRVKNAQSVATGIVDEAAAGNYDLVLLSNSTYRKHLKHVFGGKMDEVIRHANVETTVLRYRDDRPMSYRKILIPTSGYHHTERAARLAEILSKKYDCDVTVLYVGESHNEAAAALRPVIDVLAATGVRHRALFRKGPVVETILDEADRGYDMMMIGATEGPKVPNYLLGSIADKLVTRATCPVLMVKSAVLD